MTVQESKAPTVRIPHKDINDTVSLREIAQVISEVAAEVSVI